MEKERQKLEQMIINNEPYEKILKQSQKLDQLINKKVRNQVRNGK